MLAGERTYLRLLERQDLPVVAVWRNDPEVRQYFFTPYLIPVSGQDKWYDSYLSRSDSLIYLIYAQNTGERLGMIGLDHIDHRNQSAEYGRALIANPANRGKGYAADATRTLLDYGFLELNLNRIFLRVFADNAPAIRLYEHSGFQREGLERQALFIGGRFRDLVRMSILRNEFIAIRPGNPSK